MFKLKPITLAAAFIASRLVATPPWPGQPGPPTKILFRSYTQREGLLDLSVEKIAQDINGNLWIGAQRNLYQFDGVRFLAYGKKDGLPSAYVTALECTPSGTLWVGTWEGLSLRSGHTFLSAKEVPSFPTGKILSLARSADGQIWAGTSKGPCIGSSSGFRPAEGWPGGEATAIAPGRQGEIWVSSGSRLFHQNRFGDWNEWELHQCLGRETIEFIACTGSGEIYIRSANRMAVLLKDAKQFQDITKHLPGSRIFSGPLRLGADNSLWIPTEDGLISHTGSQWKLMQQKDGLPVNSLQDVLFDREGSMWVVGQGLHHMLGKNTWRAATLAEGMPGDKIWALARDPEDRILVGANRGVVRAGKNQWETIPGTEDMACLALAVNPQGDIWAGGTRGNLRFFKKGAASAIPVNKEYGLGNLRILTLLCDGEGNLWAGTDEGGLLVARPPKRLFTRVDLPGGSPKERINHILEDKEKRIWVAGQHGLAKLENGQWERFTTQHGLKHNHLLHLACSENLLFLSYFEPMGFSRFSTSDTLRLQEHFPSDLMVSAIGVDHKQRLWIATDQGAILQSAQAKQHFRASDGMIGEDCNQGALLVDEDGDAWIGTSTGLAYIKSPERVRTDETPGINITDIQLGAESIWPLSSMVVKANKHNPALNIFFAPRSFSREENLFCEYRLLGLEDKWQKTKSGEARFPKLLPGKYEFQVRVCTENGGLGPVAFIKLKVPAAWWQLRWLQVTTLVLLTGWVSRMVTTHIKRLRHNNMDLEALLSLADTLTRELEATNLTLQEQSLTDPLTGLRNRRYLDSTIQKDISLLERQYRKKPEDQEKGMPDNIDMLFLMVDVDHFKWVNDTLGHSAGDALLEQLSRVLRAATRGSDTVIRWGGEEFLVVAKQTRKQDAPVMAERIRKSVENTRFELPNGGFLRRTCSIGFAPFPFAGLGPEHLNWEQAVDLADQCMYKAKTEGRNRWIGLMPSEHSSHADLLELTNANLPSILESGLAVEWRN